ncbi:30S ribosomal protein S3 [Dissostichus eleginoides]|uniref:30S ribosomal protein S3 n=1 Tax=Dissostichus eleginoides TaxID=100907 RepID=A0AAD9FMG0_DISEL|nr:30S ribosomal protein S3 [Dissostichus eleginoides]
MALLVSSLKRRTSPENENGGKKNTQPTNQTLTLSRWPKKRGVLFRKMRRRYPSSHHPASATSLSSVGGVDTKRVVWNILARMITCTVARRINWKGVNGKRAFSKMAMKIVIFRAVRKCAITSAAMDADISQHTIRWFNLASDREGGRQERQERRRQSQDTLPVPDGQY